MAEEAGLTERQRYWRDHLAACAASGQTTKAYAKAHGLSVSMMYSWRKELVTRGVLARRPGGHEPRGFDRVRVVDSVRSPGTWHIVLPNGVEVGFSGVVVEATLDAVLRAAKRL